MAFVKDNYDPSKQGMFSKAGRFTSEKYIIFQRSEEILYGKKRQPKVQNFISTDKKVQVDYKKREKDENKYKKEENQPFYKQISRAKRNQAYSSNSKTKPVGYYNPKYSRIDKKVPLGIDISKGFENKTMPRLYHQKPDTWDQCMERPIPEKIQNPQQGLIEYDRSLPRYMDFIHNGNDPHEDRFEKLRLTQTWSNMKRVPNYYMNKTIGREDNKGYFSKEHQPDYAPNFEFGKKDIGRCQLNIAKQPARKPMFKVSDTDNETFYDYDKYTKNKDPRIKSQIFQSIKSSPNFDKLLPREIDPNSPLPSFMQKHVNMRSTLTTLHHKMLEENFYSDGRFQSTASDFMKSQSQFRKTKKQLMDEEDEEESFEQEQQQQAMQNI